MATHILVADRNSVVRKSCRRFFTASGYDVSAEVDALQCIEQLQSLSPDLPILDPEIPWRGGAGVLSWLQEQTPPPTVAVVIANGHAIADIPPDLKRLVAHRVERPTCLPDLSAFVIQLQECLTQIQTTSHGDSLGPMVCRFAGSR